MEVTNEFQVKSDGKDTLVIQTITKRMNIQESVLEMTKLRQDKLQMEKQKEEFERIIEQDQISKDLVKIVAENLKLDKLESDWAAANVDEENNLLLEMRAKVKVAKAERGYSRCKGDRKIVMANGIVAPIAEEYSLDMAHPLIQKLRMDFEKI